MKSIRYIFFISVFIFLLFESPINAQTESQNKTTNVKFEVRSAKEIYLLHEPMQFSYKIINQNDSPIEVGWAYPNVIFSMEIYKDNKIYRPTDLTNLAARHPVFRIESGQTFEGRQALTFNLLNIFPDCGKYEIVFSIGAKESDKNASLVFSDKVEITIQKPTGINAEALEFIYLTQPYPIIRGVFRGWDDKREDKTKSPAEEFIEKYSESVYVDYAILALAYRYKYEKKYDLAIRELNKLKDKENFAYSDEVERELANIEQELIRIKIRESKSN